MKRFDVQSVELSVPRNTAFVFIADPANLPRWTSAFAFVTPGRALLRTPAGEIPIELDVAASLEHGTVDWRMTFPDGNVATAFSRVVSLDGDRSLFSFILTPPPVPLEQLEGTLEAQSRTLSEELTKLKEVLGHHE